MSGREDTALVGIVSAGMYLPEPVLTAADIAAESGLPEWVVRDKLGIHQKHMAGPDDHPNEMAIKAALDCLSKTDIPAEEIDVVLCTTEEWREYLLWTTAIHLAHEIGATRAWGFDLHMRCCTTVGALKLARDMMIADPEINTVLIGGGYRLGDLVNLRNLRTSFMFNIGAGAGALLLRKNWPRNHVLGSHVMTDGSMSKHILLPASGTVQFPTDKAVASGLFYSDLLEPEAMKARLGEVSMDNWMFCIDEALRKSGYGREDLGFLNMIHVKPSAYRDRFWLDPPRRIHCHRAAGIERKNAAPAVHQVRSPGIGRWEKFEVEPGPAHERLGQWTRGIDAQ